MGKVRLFGFYLPRLFFALAVAELGIIIAAVIASALLRFDGNLQSVGEALGESYYRALFVAVILTLSLAGMGLYQMHTYEGFTGQVLRACVAFVLGWIVLALLYYVLPELYVGRGISVMACILALAGIALLRTGFFRLADMDRLKPLVLVYGAGEKARWLHERLQKHATRRGIRLLGFVPVNGRTFVGSKSPVLPISEPIHDFARRHRVDELVVAVDDRRNTLPMGELLQCRLSGIAVIDLPTFLERETGSVDLELTDPSWLVFGQGFKYGFTVVWIKRALDILFSIPLLALASPFVLAAMIGIKIEDGLDAPVVYTQVRVGERGHLFRLYKIRSMRVDAEAGGGPCWAGDRDARVTRVGRIIRKLRIDETLQIFNVLRGDMSFVGPRPERPEFTEYLERKIRYYRERATVKPGITGWAQLWYPYGASDTDAQEKLKYDLFYIKNHNTILDMLILLLTVEVVLFGKGAR